MRCVYCDNRGRCGHADTIGHYCNSMEKNCINKRARLIGKELYPERSDNFVGSGIFASPDDRDRINVMIDDGQWVEYIKAQILGIANRLGIPDHNVRSYNSETGEFALRTQNR